MLRNKDDGMPNMRQIEALLSDLSQDSEIELPAELLQVDLSQVNASMLLDLSKRLMGTVIDYKELMMMYNCALRQMRTKFEILDAEFNVRYKRNPINSINTRLKGTVSIREKLQRMGVPFSIDSIEENLNDVAGIRVVCSYVDDIYSIAQSLLAHGDITLIAQKDYIANPKPNGYRSLHLIVAIPVYFAEHTKQIKVEIQLRTIAMDCWAELEHQLHYKDESAGNQDIVAELKTCADTLAATEEKMLDIRQKIDARAPLPTEEDVLFEKMRKIDVAVG